MNRKRYNLGFSIIEFIVASAIIVTLTGLLVPQLMKYSRDKREDACLENREAVVNICEKIVYTGVPLSNLADCVNTVRTGGAYSAIPAEYQEALRRHLECPDGGTMSVTVSGGVIFCTCSNPNHSDQDVRADMVTWSGGESETHDPSFDIPAYSPPPEADTPSGGGETPSGGGSGPSVFTDGYWPYPDHVVWNDPSKVEGALDSSNPAVYIRVPSGKFAMRGNTSQYYVAIYKNGNGTRVEGTLKIYKSQADSPQAYLSQNDREAVIACNGTEYTNDTILDAIATNPSLVLAEDRDKPLDQQRFFVAPGTIYDNGVDRYIMFHQTTDTNNVYELYVDLPTQNKANGTNKYGNWYRMARDDEVH